MTQSEAENQLAEALGVTSVTVDGHPSRPRFTVESPDLPYRLTVHTDEVTRRNGGTTTVVTDLHIEPVHPLRPAAITKTMLRGVPIHELTAVGAELTRQKPFVIPPRPAWSLAAPVHDSGRARRVDLSDRAFLSEIADAARYAAHVRAEARADNIASPSVEEALAEQYGGSTDRIRSWLKVVRRQGLLDPGELRAIQSGKPWVKAADIDDVPEHLRFSSYKATEDRQ